MDRERLLEKLDIESSQDFRYYENLEALLEEEEHVEEELIREVLCASDKELLLEHTGNFFDSFISNMPDDETEIHIIIDAFKGNITSLIDKDMSDEDMNNLASEIYKFRKWYVIDNNAIDETSGDELSVRDARYEIMAAKFLGESKSMDFGRAILSGPDAYKIKIRDIL